MTHVRFVPKKTFREILALDRPAAAKADAFAALCRINVLSMVQSAGSGHLGSSFSSMDIVAWIFLNELRQGQGVHGFPYQDLYFSSKGHDVPALYAVLAGLGHLPLSALRGFRRLGGLPGHPDVGTPGMLMNTGSLGMGVSKAKGLILADRLRNTPRKVFVMLGDGELQEGQIWESLPGAANHGLHELTVVVDHNKIQSDTWVSETCPLGDIERKFQAFGWQTFRVDGHDSEALAQVFARATAHTAGPKAVIADTIKGQGVSFMDYAGHDHESYRFHSGALSEEDYLAAFDELSSRARERLSALGLGSLAFEAADLPRPPAPDGAVQRLVPAYSRSLVRMGRAMPELVVLDGDLKKDCGLEAFAEAFPERFIECGIAEQDMVSTAGGLARNGMLPVVNSFASFLTARANEQIENNAGENGKVVYAGALAGLLPAAPGHSHQAVRDLSVLSAIPNLVTVCPCTEQEVHLLVEYCLSCIPESVYFRFTSIPVHVPFDLPKDYAPQVGRGVRIREGDSLLLAAYGPVMLAQAWTAADMIAERTGAAPRVVAHPWLNRLDPDWLAGQMEGVDHVVCIEDHSRRGGQGDLFLNGLAAIGSRASLDILGLDRKPECGENHLALQAHGLDAASLADRALRSLDRATANGLERA